MKIKKSFTAIFMAVILLACNEPLKEINKDQAAIEKFDTLYLKKGSGSLSLHRWRTIKDLNQMLKLGKMSINLNLNNVSTDVKSEYKIDSGYVIYNEKVFTARIFINTKQIIAPVVNNNNQLKLDTPEYLLNSTNGYLSLEYNGNFYPPHQPISTTCVLNTGDTSGILKDAESKVKLKKKNRIEKIDTEFYLNGLNWNLYSKEVNMEILKDSIVGTVEINF